MTAHEFADKVAVVTGGARGIGRASARMMGLRGGAVVIGDIDEAACEEAVAAFTDEGIDAMGFPLDVGDHESVRACLAATLARFGGVHVLVNNAGLRLNKPALDSTDDEWDRTVRINLYSAYLCSSIFGSHMAGNGGGGIVSISSMAAKTVFPRRPAYAAAKAGINALTRVLAVELAPYGIRANAVGPGQTRTELYERWLAAGLLDVDADNARTPLGRFAAPEEIAEVVTFLASERARYVTGQTWYVDGGWTATR
jgi:NAD(P)-dependent dehydrogenase (short-subunit alcohol dehydrogenase family)